MNVNFKRVLPFLLFCLVNIASAQDKPKLGLVLSGGGAKGIAHIGALKAMEEAGLRPDFIAGTSMGSVIGSLYALGYSADQIEQIVLDLDWNAVLSNEVPLNYIAFEEKEYYSRYLAAFPMYKGSVALSSGLIKGQMLTEVLMEYLWPSFEYQDFDHLPIPFRCVATDVRTGDPIVFKSGSLPTAVRASMALPTAFTAVDLDTTLVVDGGVLDNFPVEIVKQMGADYIIGVNVSAPQSEVPTSMMGILLSLATIPSEKKLPEEIEACDIYVEPDMMGYTTASFNKVPEILQLGKDYAQKYKTEFEGLAQSMGMEREPFTRESKERTLRIYDISLKGNKLFSDVLIKEKLGIEPGERVSYSELQEGIRRVYGINGFSKVDYELQMHSDSVAALELRLHENLADHIYVSVHADNVFSAGILVNYTSRNLLGKESRSIFALDISKNPRFRFDYYKYVGRRKRLAFNFRYDFMSEQLPNYDEGKPEDIVANRVHRVAANFLTTQSLKSSYSIGGFYENNSSKSQFGIIVPDYVDRIGLDNFGLRFSWLKNSYNDRNFPTKGAESELIVDYVLNTSVRLRLPKGVDSLDIGGVKVDRDGLQDALDQVSPEFVPDPFFRVHYNFQSFVSVLPKTQLVPRVSVGLSPGFDDVDKVRIPMRIGGWQRVWRDDSPVLGLQYSELDSVYNFGVVGLKIQHQMFGNFFLKYGADVLGYYGYVPLDDIENNFSFDELVENNLLIGYGATLTWRTRLGPISGGISRNSKDGYFRYYFALGFSMNYSD